MTPANCRYWHQESTYVLWIINFLDFFGNNGISPWSQEGSIGNDYLWGAAALEDGGVVVAGSTNGTWNGVTSLGEFDFVAVKLDSEGTMEWDWQVSEKDPPDIGLQQGEDIM